MSGFAKAGGPQHRRSGGCLRQSSVFGRKSHQASAVNPNPAAIRTSRRCHAVSQWKWKNRLEASPRFLMSGTSAPSGSIRRHEPGGSELGLDRDRPDTDHRCRGPSCCPIPNALPRRILRVLPTHQRTHRWGILVSQHGGQHIDFDFHVDVLVSACC